MAWLIVPLVAACAPNTQFRRTALVPAPTPVQRSGAPLAAGEIRAQGHLELSEGRTRSGSVSSLDPIISSRGDPGLLTPELIFGGSIYGAVSDHFELGVHGRFASSRNAERGAIGVFDLSGNAWSVEVG
ncbi:MAG: hypothetical protein AAFY60_11315, partial [Myxococcota bacterium]